MRPGDAAPPAGWQKHLHDQPVLSLLLKTTFGEAALRPLAAETCDWPTFAELPWWTLRLHHGEEGDLRGRLIQDEYRVRMH